MYKKLPSGNTKLTEIMAASVLGQDNLPLKAYESKLKENGQEL